MPLSSLPPSHRPLFAYYRSRIEAFESDRQYILHRLHTLTRHGSSSASCASTAHSAADTVTLAGLERESSERRVQACEERRRRLECEAAMRAMAAERLADKRRLAQLAQLTLPKRTAQQHFAQRNLPAQHATHDKENCHSHAGKQAGDAAEWKQAASAERAAREQSDREWRQQVDVLAGERRRREKEWEQRESQLAGWEDQTRRERDQARADLHDVMGEYMQLRHTAQHNERVSLERLTAVAAQHSQALAHLRSHAPIHSSASAAAADSLLLTTASRSTSTRDRGAEERDRPWSSRSARVVDDRIIEYYSGDMHELTARHAQLQHELRRLRDERAREQQAAATQYGGVADECKRWRGKYERECERRALQCEGYEADIRRMRERLWAVEELLVGISTGGGRSGSAEMGKTLYGIEVEGAEAEVAAMNEQLTALTERLALSVM